MKPYNLEIKFALAKKMRKCICYYHVKQLLDSNSVASPSCGFIEVVVWSQRGLTGIKSLNDVNLLHVVKKKKTTLFVFEFSCFSVKCAG